MTNPARDLINKFYAREVRREASKKVFNKNTKSRKRVKKMSKVGTRSILRKKGGVK